MAINDKNRIAAFEREDAYFQSLSETNSLMYNLKLSGSNGNSTIRGPNVYVNETPRARVAIGRGLTVIVLDNKADFVEQKTFDTYGTPGPSCDSFIEYMKSLSGELIACVISNDAIKSTVEFETYMKTIGSVSWPDRIVNTYYRTSAAFVYLPKYKKIVMEDYCLSDNAGGTKEDLRVIISTVFDNYDDIGSTGFTKFIVSDPDEYSGSTYDFKTFAKTTFSEAIVNKGDTLLCTFELYTPQAVWSQASNQGRCRLSVNWELGGVYKGGVPTMSTKPDTWEKFEFFATIPNDNYDGLAVMAYRYPLAVTSGTVQVRNVSISHVSRRDKVGVNAAMGINGIRNNSITEIERPVPGSRRARLLNLGVADKTAKISGERFNEY